MSVLAQATKTPDVLRLPILTTLRGKRRTNTLPLPQRLPLEMVLNIVRAAEVETALGRLVGCLEGPM